MRDEETHMTTKQALNPISVANYLLKKGDDLTPLKLIKLVYLCHGWHYGIFGTPLLNEEPEAWRYGPVFPKLYQEVKGYVASPVPGLINGGTNDTLTKQQIKLIDMVYDAYKECNGMELTRRIHQRGTPWDRVWKKGNGINAKISHDLIKEYYEELVNA